MVHLLVSSLTPPQASSPDSPTSRRRRSAITRQLTLPCSLSGSMSYLQVPGQERQPRPSPSCHDRRLRLPSGGIDEVGKTQGGSPVLVKRRLGQQASVDSYYSFASEGDGDIFASMENVGERRGGGRLGRQTSFCIPDSNISEYSEFNEDFFSSISELFVGRQRGRLENQGTFSEQGSIRSLSIDQEEITFELPGMREEEAAAQAATPTSNFLNIPSMEDPAPPPDLPLDLRRQPSDDCDYMSSSCSISMSSDIESSHQITVPVFIEPAPPEVRGDGGGQGSAQSYWQHDGAPRLVHQETMHTDSGLDTEEICPASPYGGRYSADMLNIGISPPANKGARHLEEEGALRMVLVRDIGIQCSADSPTLSTRGRKGSRSSLAATATATATPPPSQAPHTFAAELLF